MEGIDIVTFECNDCGWSWFGNFIYCPNCKGSNANILEFDDMGSFIERMQLIRELLFLEDVDDEEYFILEDTEIE